MQTQGGEGGRLETPHEGVGQRPEQTPGRRGSMWKDLVSHSAEALWGEDSSEENQV